MRDAVRLRELLRRVAVPHDFATEVDEAIALAGTMIPEIAETVVELADDGEHHAVGQVEHGTSRRGLLSNIRACRLDDGAFVHVARVQRTTKLQIGIVP